MAAAATRTLRRTPRRRCGWALPARHRLPGELLQHEEGPLGRAGSRACDERARPRCRGALAPRRQSTRRSPRRRSPRPAPVYGRSRARLLHLRRAALGPTNRRASDQTHAGGSARRSRSRRYAHPGVHRHGCKTPPKELREPSANQLYLHSGPRSTRFPLATGEFVFTCVPDTSKDATAHARELRRRGETAGHGTFGTFPVVTFDYSADNEPYSYGNAGTPSTAALAGTAAGAPRRRVAGTVPPSAPSCSQIRQCRCDEESESQPAATAGAGGIATFGHQRRCLPAPRSGGPGRPTSPASSPAQAT